GVLAVHEGDGLYLDDLVGARRQVVEAVVASGVGRRGQRERLALRHAVELHGDAGDPRLTRVLHAVVAAGGAAVVKDGARQRGQANFTEVVVHAVDAGPQGDVAELVVDRVPAGRADGVLAVGVAGGLDLEKVVAAGAQVVELVEAVGVGGHGAVHGAVFIHAVQDDGHSRDSRLAGLLDAVVEAAHADVGVDVAGQAGRLDLAEVVVRHVARADGQRDHVNAGRVGQDDAVTRLLAVEEALRLAGLVDGVIAGFE